jgi:hypothetical protein
VTALIRMRLLGYLRTGRVVAPLLACLVVIFMLYGGGRAQAGEAYGVSALVMFAVLAWQTKLLLDAEPEVQRRLAIVAVGSASREWAAGLLAAALAAFPLIVVAMGAPWALAGIQGPVRPEDPSLWSGVAVGVWAHLIVVAPAVALGALASRAVTRTFGFGVAALVTGAVLSLVLGLRGSPMWWLVPPMMAITRLAARGFAASGVATLSLQAALWTTVAVLAYARIRRARA